MIRFEHLSKTFQTKDGAFEALKDVSFEIEKGDIYGVIGYSGAGKSTLIRMVNALERPTSGKIFVEDKDIGSLSAKELRSLRKGIGMIFQQFNLLESKTIYDNVAIALKLNGTPKKDIEARVNELLEFVELSDKKSYYPGSSPADRNSASVSQGHLQIIRRFFSAMRRPAPSTRKRPIPFSIC